MGKWLAAVAKGLSYAAGPFKPVVDFVLRLYDGELAERADKNLQKIIVEHQDLLVEAVDILREIRKSDGVLGAQLANGAEVVLQLVRSGTIHVTSPEELEAALQGPLVGANVTAFWRNNFVCVNTVETECVEIYGNALDRFLVCVEGGGFRTATLPMNAASDTVIRRCIRQILTTNQYKLPDRTAIFGELCKDADGSVILETAHQLLLLEAQSGR